jgi:DNA topoisomerase IA
MDEKIEYSAENLIRFLKTFIEDIVDERIEVQMEMRLTSIIEEAIADVPVFDISDHVSDIEDIVNEVLSNTSFSVTVD